MGWFSKEEGVNKEIRIILLNYLSENITKELKDNIIKFLARLEHINEDKEVIAALIEYELFRANKLNSELMNNKNLSGQFLKVINSLGTNKIEEKEEFIYIPSIKLYVAKELSYKGKNWNECKELLKKDSKKDEVKYRMLTIPEFIEFLNFIRDKPIYADEEKKLFDEITKMRSPGRGEWLDAVFTKDKDENLYITYYNAKKEKEVTEKLDKDTLIEGKGGISLNSWLGDMHTKQGLPHNDVERGNFDYFQPSLAPLLEKYQPYPYITEFYAYKGGVLLRCDGIPSGRPEVGVRCAKEFRSLNT